MRFYGKIGFAITSEDPEGSGIYVPTITERNYKGTVISYSKRNENSQEVNDNINLSNKISVIMDPFIKQNLQSIAYVEFLGTLWKVKSVDIQYPRLVLSIGDVYNQVGPSSENG